MKDVKLNEYSKFVDSVTSEISKDTEIWVETLDGLDDLVNISLLNNGVMGLCGECGELTDLVKKINWQGKPYTDEIRGKIEKELGDILFYVIMTCQATLLDPNEVIQRNIDKLSARYPNGFQVERSEGRNEAQE